MWWKTSWEKPTHMRGKLLSYCIDWIPISALCRVNLGFGRAFVKTSAVCSGSRQFCTSIILSVIRSLIQWWRNAMCFDRWWNWGLCVSVTDPSLSPLIPIGDFCENPSSPYKFLSHVASRPASDSATYSASVDESAITVCFFYFHVIAPPDPRKT